jgi:nitrogenase molybdenum-iron protein beta chain
LEQKYGTPFLHYPVLPVGAEETNRFLRELGAYAGISKETVEKVIAREEPRFYRYLSSLIDFLAEFRNNLPTELYTVADSTYGIGMSSFLVNEIGFIPRGLYITDSAPEKYTKGIIDAALSREGKFTGLISFDIDGGTIQQDIIKKLGNSRKSLFLGSGWEKFLAQKTSNYYSFISLPIPETVIITKSFLGYTGGLSLVEEIYSDLFKTKTHFSANTVSAEIEENTKAM